MKMKILKYQNILKSICLIGSEIKITHKKDFYQIKTSY